MDDDAARVRWRRLKNRISLKLKHTDVPQHSKPAVVILLSNDLFQKQKALQIEY